MHDAMVLIQPAHFKAKNGHFFKSTTITGSQTYWQYQIILLLLVLWRTRQHLRNLISLLNLALKTIILQKLKGKDHII